MKKFFKGLMIFLLVIILIPVIIIALLFTPIKSKDIVMGEELEVGELLKSSIQGIDLVNGGDISITHDDIGKLLTYNIQESVGTDENISIDSVKIDGNEDGEIKLRVYTKILPIKFPLRLTLKLETENVRDYLNVKVKSMRLGNIPLPKSVIGKILSKQVDVDELEDNDVVSYVNLEDLEVEFSYNYMATNFELFGELGKLVIDDECFKISVKPDEQISEVVNVIGNEIKPIAKDIKNKLTDLKDKVSVADAKTIEKVELIITKIETDNIENVSASEIAETITEIQKLDGQTINEVVSVFMTNTSTETKEKLVRTFAKDLSDDEVKEVLKNIGNLK